MAEAKDTLDRYFESGTPSLSSRAEDSEQEKVKVKEREKEGTVAKKRRQSTKSKKEKDPNAPRHPTSAYMLFSKHRRAELKKADSSTKPDHV